MPAEDYAAPAAEVWSAQPAESVGSAWQEVPSPAAVEPAMDTQVSTPGAEPAAEVWPDPSAIEAPASPALESMAMETSVSPEPSFDSIEPVEPGPAEAEVERMDEVPESFSPGDAVQTFLSTSEGLPYEPTTPGEPTHAPEELAATA